MSVIQLKGESRALVPRPKPRRKVCEDNRPKILRIRNLVKSYYKGLSRRRRIVGALRRGFAGSASRIEVPVLRGVNLEVRTGEFLSIVGLSGSGKSTLLHLIGTLDQADAGEIWFHDQRIDDVPARKREEIRNTTFGFVFQFYHLLPELTALENVMMPLMIRHGVSRFWLSNGQIRRDAEAILARVGLEHRHHHYPSELSGGEMQRITIARALSTNPQVLLADEPTGNLDVETGRQIMELLVNLNRQDGLTIIMVTHDHTLIESTHRCVELAEGRIAP